MHEVETMFSAREVPWHGLGVVTPDVLTASDAIVAAGLDWTVEKRPIFKKDGEVYVEIPNKFALERSSDKVDLAVISDVYKPFQNKQAFTFMDNLVDSGDAKYETAGSLRGGRVIFVTMEVPVDLNVAGEDAHNMYLLLRTTHDGSGRISCYVVVTRVVCMNTLTWAINGAKHSWGVTHTADVEGKVSEAREALGLSFKYSEAFKKEADRLTEIKVTDDEIIRFLEAEMPIKPKRDAEIEAILENYRGSETVGNFRGTAWGFINGLTEYTEHVKANRSDQAMFTRVIDGPDAKMRTNLKNKLLARAAS